MHHVCYHTKHILQCCFFIVLLIDRISILNLYNSYSINIGSANILQWWNEKIIYNYYTCLTVTQVRLTYAMLEMMEGIPNIMSVSSFYL